MISKTSVIICHAAQPLDENCPDVTKQLYSVALRITYKVMFLKVHRCWWILFVVSYSFVCPVRFIKIWCVVSVLIINFIPLLWLFLFVVFFVFTLADTDCLADTYCWCVCLRERGIWFLTPCPPRRLCLGEWERETGTRLFCIVVIWGSYSLAFFSYKPETEIYGLIDTWTDVLRPVNHKGPYWGRNQMYCYQYHKASSDSPFMTRNNTAVEDRRSLGKVKLNESGRQAQHAKLYYSDLQHLSWERRSLW